MSRRPASFRQIDVKRAAKGVAAAGLPVGRIEIDPEGRIVIFTTEGAADFSGPDPDELLR